jgi:hypothetical protein
VDGEDSFQICRAAANILNMQAQTVNKGWSSSFGGVGMGLTPSHKKAACCKMLYMASKLKTKLNSVACSPQANYTDRATAAC